MVRRNDDEAVVEVAMVDMAETDDVAVALILFSIVVVVVGEKKRERQRRQRASNGRRSRSRANQESVRTTLLEMSMPRAFSTR